MTGAGEPIVLAVSAVVSLVHEVASAEAAVLHAAVVTAGLAATIHAVAGGPLETLVMLLLLHQPPHHAGHHWTALLHHGDSHPQVL